MPCLVEYHCKSKYDHHIAPGILICWFESRRLWGKCAYRKLELQQIEAAWAMAMRAASKLYGHGFYSNK
jgi:hypothetical protein